ncbi:hypothetical protein SAMN04487886_100465 [Clostridium sp. DSM 8431]|nr:hypothetical protein SAMN04487886_100465 [Clostridium sp. DSM 8431]
MFNIKKNFILFYALKKEFEYTSNSIKNITGYYPKFFRPPYIAVKNEMFEIIDVPFICGIGCEDWIPEISAKTRAKTIIDNVKDGSIILLHDATGNINTVNALPIIIESLKKDNYEFVTVTNLFNKVKINNNFKNKIWTNIYDLKNRLLLDFSSNNSLYFYILSTYI